MTTAQDIIAKVEAGAKVIAFQVRGDIHNFALPVKIDHAAWVAWLSEQFKSRGMDAMAAEVSRHTLYSHAKALAFEVLYDLGGYHTPHLCIPSVLEGEAFVTYWRAVAIAANSL